MSYQRLDLANLDSVRDFAQRFIYNESRLDILINNAGKGSLGQMRVSQGMLGFPIDLLGQFWAFWGR